MFTLQVGGNLLEIDMLALPPGSYMLQVSKDEKLVNHNLIIGK
jgi:hypothetical protein